MIIAIADNCDDFALHRGQRGSTLEPRDTAAHSPIPGIYIYIYIYICMYRCVYMYMYMYICVYKHIHNPSENAHGIVAADVDAGGADQSKVQSRLPIDISGVL